VSFLQELKRRNVWRMAALYAVVAWLVMQVADVVIGLAALPEWLGRAALVVLAIGFPIALVFAWFYEITPQGLKLEKDVDRSGSIAHATGRRMDLIVIAVLSAAVIVFAIDKWWLGRGFPAFAPPRNSIAVLAFANMSADPEREYLSDGLSEDLLNLLAQIPELRVISRTSAFSYKGKDLRLSEIARELNVAHVLEGSVRQVGERLRVTAQLIEARTDTHLWSQTYDGDMGDVFAIQDEIAARVVDQLKVALLGAAPSVRAVDPESYTLYLQARHLGRQGNREALASARSLYERALEIDPGHAAAWVGLASVYVNETNNSLLPVDQGYALAREAAQQALAIDPGEAGAHARLGWIADHHDGDLAAAARHYEKALALAPRNASILQSAASFAHAIGRLTQAMRLEDLATTLDPLDPVGHNNRGDSYLSAGRYDEAIASLRTALTLSPKYFGAQYRVGVALLLAGEPEEALAAMEAETFEAWRLLGLAMAHHALGDEAASRETLDAMIAGYERDAAYNIAYVFAYRGEADGAFEWLEKAVEYNDPGLSEIVAEPLFRNVRPDPRWVPFLERIGRAPAQLDVIEFEPPIGGSVAQAS
jgi:TolB-like protein/Tfp pilus assembly protein PilF